jgi:peptide/nickel transport system ATP-binding protein
MKLLFIENLSVSYLQKKSCSAAVKKVSLSVDFQEKVAIIGGSGSGKTSLISAFLPPKARRDKRIDGTIFYKGKILWKEIFPLIAFIFQDPLLALNPTLPMGKQLMETLLFQKKGFLQAKKEALGLMEEVAIVDAERVFHLYPHEMSRGMLQRITIAIALAQKSELIVADEPTTALDVATASQILSLLQTMQKKQKFSLLLISHQLALVHEMCQRTYVLHEGEIIEEGDTHALFSSPQHPETQKLIQSAHFFSHLPFHHLERP